MGARESGATGNRNGNGNGNKNRDGEVRVGVSSANTRQANQADSNEWLCSLHIPNYNKFLPFVNLSGADVGGYYFVNEPDTNPLETQFLEEMERNFDALLSAISPDFTTREHKLFFSASPTNKVILHPEFTNFIKAGRDKTKTDFDKFSNVLRGIISKERVLDMISDLLSPPFKNMAFAGMIVWGGAIVAVCFYIPAVCILMCGRDAWDRSNATPEEVVPVDSKGKVSTKVPPPPGAPVSPPPHPSPNVPNEHERDRKKSKRSTVTPTTSHSHSHSPIHSPSPSPHKHKSSSASKSADRGRSQKSTHSPVSSPGRNHSHRDDGDHGSSHHKHPSGEKKHKNKNRK